MRVEIIDKSEFVAVAMNADKEIFVIHIAALAEPTTMPIHPFCQAQVVALTSEKTGIPTEYSEFCNVFSSDSAVELPKYTKINNHSTNLLNNKQPLYGPIYSLGPVELETLKTYIEANLASGFIRPSKSPASAPIPFIRKNFSSLCLCVDY